MSAFDASLLEWVYEFAQKNFMLVFAICMLLYRVYQAQQPFPETGGRVEAVHDDDELDAKLKKAKDNKQVAVVDFYATWCPPCKAAAPRYGAMREEMPDALFLKVDVDKCKAAAQKHGITAMPTFHVFGADGDKFDSVRGADLAKVKKLVSFAVDFQNKKDAETEKDK